MISSSDIIGVNENATFCYRMLHLFFILTKTTYNTNK